MRAHKKDPAPGSIGERMSLSRIGIGLTQQQMADLLGISRQTVINHEQNKHGPRRITVRQWALATGVREQWLQTGKGPVRITSADPVLVTRGSRQPGWLRSRRAKRRRRPHHGALFPADSPERVTLLRPTG